jgi:hypothetical protein
LRSRAGILSGFQRFDPDAATYIAAVEFEDGEALETGVKDAINAFVVGLKADGIWNAVLASCIMMGARTIEGALVPLRGGAPTAYNQVSGDYDRETGIIGNSSNKYIDTEFNDASTYRLDYHAGVFQNNTSANAKLMARTASDNNNSVQIRRNNPTTVTIHGRSATTDNGGVDASPAFIIQSRDNASDFIVHNNGTGLTLTRAAQASTSGVNYLINRVHASSATYGSSRISFYTIGTALDATGLANYETRILALVAAIAAAI